MMLKTLTFTLAVFAGAYAVPAAADERDDCADLGNPERAVKACSDLLAREGEAPAARAAAFSNRCSAYGIKGDYPAAIDDCNHAIELNPDDAKAYNNRAWIHFKTGKASRGFFDVERSLELSPGDPNALNTRGHIMEAIGRREEAISDFRQALEKDPSDQDSEEALKRLGATR